MPACARSAPRCFDGHSFFDHNAETACDWSNADKIRLDATQDIETILLRFVTSGYAESDYNAARTAEQNKSAEPRYCAKGHHMFEITARPRPLSVTESFALPPRPQAANMSHTNKFSIREWLVPPILLPIFLVLLVAAAMFIQW